MTHVPNSVLIYTPVELGSGAESNPIAKAAAAERCDKPTETPESRRDISTTKDGCSRPVPIRCRTGISCSASPRRFAVLPL